MKNRRRYGGEQRGGSSTTPKRGGRKQLSQGSHGSRDVGLTHQTSAVTPKIYTHNRIMAPESKKSTSSIQPVPPS